MKQGDDIETTIVPEAESESVEDIFTGESAEGLFEAHLDYDWGYCPCGGRLLPSGVSGIAEEETPEKIINTVRYLYCDNCGQDYAFKMILEEIDLKEVISKED